MNKNKVVIFYLLMIVNHVAHVFEEVSDSCFSSSIYLLAFNGKEYNFNKTKFREGEKK
ncbi:MAG: hypothetical protein ABR927_18960 [Bacteroidales bacterium]|jgi:hypothetical protein